MRLKNSKTPSFFIVGLALFSMFFGGGNLIFPLYMGQIAHGDWIFGLGGFLLTAVLMPTLGVIAMVVYQGDYRRFFSSLGPTLGALLTFVLLTVWIPLGSAPRAIALTYTSLGPYLRLPELWCFSLLYCALVFFIVRHKQQMINILGYFLTPALLLCLGVVVALGLGNSAATSDFAGATLVHRGMQEGYNTMDLIASFFFSASVIQILRPIGDSPKKCLSVVLKASVVGMILLGIVYTGLIGLAASNGAILQGVAKDQLIAIISLNALGPHLGGVAALAVLLACLTTVVALVVVFSDFLIDTFLGGRQKGQSLAIVTTLMITFIMSIFGLDGVTAVTAPILKVCYPLLIVMIGVNVIREWSRQRERTRELATET